MCCDEVQLVSQISQNDADLRRLWTRIMSMEKNALHILLLYSSVMAEAFRFMCWIPDESANCL